MYLKYGCIGRLYEQSTKVTMAATIKLLGTSKPTATRAVELLAEIGILVETTGRKRDRSFAYRAYLDKLRAGTELERG